MQLVAIIDNGQISKVSRISGLNNVSVFPLAAMEIRLPFIFVETECVRSVL